MDIATHLSSLFFFIYNRRDVYGGIFIRVCTEPGIDPLVAHRLSFDLFAG